MVLYVGKIVEEPKLVSIVSNRKQYIRVIGSPAEYETPCRSSYEPKVSMDQTRWNGILVA